MTTNDDILIKLFDTLKESTDRNATATKELIQQQLNLVNYIKTLPIDGLKNSLKDHENTCNLNHEKGKENLDETYKMLGKIHGRIKTMITVVIVAFTILCGTYVVIRTSVDDSRIQQIEESIDSHQEEILEALLEKLNLNIKEDKE